MAPRGTAETRALAAATHRHPEASLQPLELLATAPEAAVRARESVAVHEPPSTRRRPAIEIRTAQAHHIPGPRRNGGDNAR